MKTPKTERTVLALACAGMITGLSALPAEAWESRGYSAAGPAEYTVETLPAPAGFGHDGGPGAGPGFDVGLPVDPPTWPPEGRERFEIGHPTPVDPARPPGNPDDVGLPVDPPTWPPRERFEIGHPTPVPPTWPPEGRERFEIGHPTPVDPARPPGNPDDVGLPVDPPTWPPRERFEIGHPTPVPPTWPPEERRRTGGGHPVEHCDMLPIYFPDWRADRRMSDYLQTFCHNPGGQIPDMPYQRP